jgi:hypothetical protein
VPVEGWSSAGGVGALGLPAADGLGGGAGKAALGAVGELDGDGVFGDVDGNDGVGVGAAQGEFLQPTVCIVRWSATTFRLSGCTAGRISAKYAVTATALQGEPQVLPLFECVVAGQLSSLLRKRAAVSVLSRYMSRVHGLESLQPRKRNPVHYFVKNTHSGNLLAGVRLIVVHRGSSIFPLMDHEMRYKQ